jgi:hypothetical protein
VDALKREPAFAAMLVPSVVAELAQDPVCLEYVAANLKLIMYVGGDLPQAVGDIGKSCLRSSGVRQSGRNASLIVTCALVAMSMEGIYRLLNLIQQWPQRYPSAAGGARQKPDYLTSCGPPNWGRKTGVIFGSTQTPVPRSIKSQITHTN